MDLRQEALQRRSANIFVNYRREDTAGYAGRLFDHLNGRFPGRVFMDVDTIEPGIDFGEIIEQAVGCCEVLLVMIGREWLHVTDSTGRQRLHNENDFVRMEVSTALERSIRVIPVLVEGARMPRPEDLPADLARLTRRNAIELSDVRWGPDVDRLIQTIEGVLQERAPSAILPVSTAPIQPPPPPLQETTKARSWLAPGLALALLLGLALAVWAGWRLARHEAPPDRVEKAVPSQGPVASPPTPTPTPQVAPAVTAKQPERPKDKPEQRTTTARPQKDVPVDAPKKEGLMKSVKRWGKNRIQDLRDRKKNKGTP